MASGKVVICYLLIVNGHHLYGLDLYQIIRTRHLPVLCSFIVAYRYSIGTVHCTSTYVDFTLQLSTQNNGISISVLHYVKINSCCTPSPVPFQFSYSLPGHLIFQ